MSARYGSKTRSGEAVSGLGRRATAGGAGGVLQPYEEVFTAPGTWTCPATTTSVQVLLVGGGGGGGGATYTNPPQVSPLPGFLAGSGGGGGVRVVNVPVSGPVPVTVGAGGSGGPATTPTVGTTGGDSSFGPESVGGGGGGGGFLPTSIPTAPTYPSSGLNIHPDLIGVSAPPNGGGGGGGAYFGWAIPGFPSATLFNFAGYGGVSGSNGADGTRASVHPQFWGGGAGGGATTNGQQLNSERQTISGAGYLTYGTGGSASINQQLTSTSWGPQAPYIPAPAGANGINGLANTGMGGTGAGALGPSQAKVGGSGGSGIVIVRWFA